MEKVLLVKTAAEISLKSSFVRRHFMSILEQNIRAALKANKVVFGKFSRAGGRVFVDCGDERAVPVLEKVFGVHSFVFAEKKLGTTSSTHPTGELGTTLGGVVDSAVGFAVKNFCGAKSFAVRAKRVGAKGFSSKDVEVMAGARILEKMPGLKVNLSKPEKTVFVEVFPRECYVYGNVFFGPKGLPVGVSGKIGVFFEKGGKKEFDCAWLLLKRGCKVFGVVEKEGKGVGLLLERLAEWNCFSGVESGSVGEAKKFGCVAFARADSMVSEKGVEEFARFDDGLGELVLRPLLLAPRGVLA